MDQHHHQGWDWELLSDDDEEEGFLEGAQNQQQIYSTASSRMIPMPMVIYTMDYFICPPLHKIASITPPQEQEQEESESMEGKKQLMIHPSPAPTMNLLDPVSQVSFKNIDQFVEIKVDSNNILPLANFQSPDKKLEEIVDSSSNNGGGGGGFNIWKWGLSGIGAICSFGVAATLCIVILSSHGHAKRRRITHHQRRITAATISFGGYYDDSSSL